MIGVIADTHGLLRPEAVAALQGSTLVLHAGDIGPPEIIEELERIAPVHAVRGNCDHGAWATTLPATEALSIDGAVVYMIHDIGLIDVNPDAAGIAAVIHGHSHEPSIDQRDGVLYLNPGSAGPRRFSLPVSIARLHLSADGAAAEIVMLDV